jgi:hypothetical protein
LPLQLSAATPSDGGHRKARGGGERAGWILLAAYPVVALTVLAR